MKGERTKSLSAIKGSQYIVPKLKIMVVIRRRRQKRRKKSPIRMSLKEKALWQKVCIKDYQ